MGRRTRNRSRREAPGSEPEGQGGEKAEASRVVSHAREWGKTLLLTVGLLIVIRAFLVQTFVIISGSMEDTLLIGDFVMVNRLALGTRIPGTSVSTPGYSSPHRGDVLVFDPAHETFPLVKRLVGMPGDTLRMVEKAFFINGVQQNEPYVKYTPGSPDGYAAEMMWQFEHLLPSVERSTYHPTRDNWGPLVVPEGNYFLMGDNRDGSRDSRYWGLIERWRLMGRAMFYYYSFDSTSSVPFAFLRRVRWGRIGRAVH